MSLRKLEIEQKPTLIALGTLKSFGDLVKSKTKDSPYFYENVELKGIGSSPSAKFRLMWAPAFFDPTFNLKTLNDGQKFVFSKNIGSKEAAGGFLEGLCGSEDNEDHTRDQRAG